MGDCKAASAPPFREVRPSGTVITGQSALRIVALTTPSGQSTIQSHANIVIKPGP
jgi:hypothetical protein